MHESIYHTNEAPYAFAISKELLKIRIRMKKNEALACDVLHADRYDSPGTETPQAMEIAGSTRHYDYFETVLHVPKRRLRYLFHIRTRSGDRIWYGENGAAEQRAEAGYFQYAYICDADIPQVPSWLAEAIVYQVFPDRFCNGETANDPTGTLPWTTEAKPDTHSFYGGDLQGIIAKLPYLAELGVNTIYLTPVFQSPSNHKYDTTDYYKVDPAFGDNDTLKRLVQTAHDMGMRVILDAVFNHTGDTFFAFRDVMANGEASPYKNWYHIRNFPIVQTPAPNYETFSHSEKSMPKLNTQLPEVSEYLVQVAHYWVKEAGIDGWRLDVANEVDQRFWRRLRGELKETNEELALIGEIMHQAGPWLRGDQFDGVMNYLFREALLDFFARQTIGAAAFTERLIQIRMNYTDQANEAMLQLLGSHDTERFLTACRKGGIGWNSRDTAEARMMLAVCFQFTYSGMPMIYYGDEVGMVGESDPDCRRPMIWEQQKQNRRFFELYKTLIALRKTNPALSRGTFRTWFTDEARTAFGFVRSYANEHIAVIVNNAQQQLTLETKLPCEFAGVVITDALQGGVYRVSEAGGITIRVGAFGCAILLPTVRSEGVATGLRTV